MCLRETRPLHECGDKASISGWCRSYCRGHRVQDHVVCLATGLYRLPKRLAIECDPDGYSFQFQYFLSCLMSPSSCLRLLPLFLVPHVFPSIKCFRRQFVCKLWPIQLAFFRFVVCRMLLSPCMDVTLHVSHDSSLSPQCNSNVVASPHWFVSFIHSDKWLNLLLVFRWDIHFKFYYL